nr:class I SAM-dependent methyltransferase [Bradyrhizobium sp. WSM471]
MLEIGCGMGPNLFLLWQADHGLTLTGMDPSRVAIDGAGAEMRQREASSIGLEVGAADQLCCLPDSSADVVLADAVLMYIPPDLIAKTLAEMLRVSRFGVVLSTWHFDGSVDKGPEAVQTVHYDEETWVYDYRRLLATTPAIKVEISPYPADVWRDKRWNRYGAIVMIQHDR